MIEKKSHSTALVAEKAILVAVQAPRQSDFITKEYLDELAFLAGTSGVETLARFTQRLERPDSKTYVGKGKLEEILQAVNLYEADMLIFDDDLTPSQVRNLETLSNIKILDRSLLILNIFSQRAQTAQAKTQVELAQYQYLYPRLTRMWSHLTKQKGGVGMRGPGEKELETDRRIVQDRISLLKEKLRTIDKQSVTRRQGRERMVRVAIVGYTNAGKSTVMNLLTKSQVLAENKLFATVDSTVRKLVLNHVPFLLTDTVGFIRKLPTHLIESFKSTLDEVREADVLMHVIDLSNPMHEQHISVTLEILEDIGAGDKPIITVFNKTDLLEQEAPVENEDEFDFTGSTVKRPASLAELKQLYLAKSPNTIFISAEFKENISSFRKMIYEEVLAQHMSIYPNYLKPAGYYEGIEDLNQDFQDTEDSPEQQEKEDE